MKKKFGARDQVLTKSYTYAIAKGAAQNIFLLNIEKSANLRALLFLKLRLFSPPVGFEEKIKVLSENE